MSLDDAMGAAEARKEARLAEEQQILNRWGTQALSVREKNAALTQDFLAKADAAGLRKDVVCWQRPLDYLQEHADPSSVSGWRLTIPSPEYSLILLSSGWYTIQCTEFYTGFADHDTYIRVNLSNGVVYSEMCWYGPDGKLAVHAAAHTKGCGHGDKHFCEAFPGLHSDLRALDTTVREYQTQYLAPWKLAASMAHLLVEGSPMQTRSLDSLGEAEYRRGT